MHCHSRERYVVDPWEDGHVTDEAPLALIFYYGAVLVSSSRFAVEDIMTVFSMLLFSIGYASSVLGWSEFLNALSLHPTNRV